MTDENKDQVIDEVIEGDQSSDKQSGEATKEPSISEIADLARGLQKGYTQTRQELADIKENLEAIVQEANRQSGATSGDEEYMTVGKMRELLAEQQRQSVAVQQQAESYIESTLADLRAEGVIKTKEDEDSLMRFAIEKKELDLEKAAERWNELRLAREEGKKEINVAKTKARQDEGSKVGTSSKASGGEQEGISLKKLQEFKRDFGW